jgi:dTDP-D-glucose 4,6-dehydratase
LLFSRKATSARFTILVAWARGNLTMARRILDLTGKPLSLLSHVQDRRGHDRRYALNCKKIQDELSLSKRASVAQLTGTKMLGSGLLTFAAVSIFHTTRNTT